MEVLGELGRLSGTGFSDDDDDAVVPDNPEEFLPDGEHRQELALLLQSLRLRELGLLLLKTKPIEFYCNLSSKLKIISLKTILIILSR